MGVDYQDEKFIVHIQILNFSNIAKTEQSKIGINVPTWIGKGEGRTIVDALDQIVITSEMNLFFGHLKTVVCSERLLEHVHKVAEVYDALNRQSEVRYNVWVFGTKEKMTDLFSQKSVLNLSPIDSVLLQLDQAYQQGSYVQPLYGFKAIAHIHEPGRSTLLPSISLTSRIWKEDRKTKSMFIVDGIYVIGNEAKPQYRGKIHVNHMLGSRWLQRNLNITPIIIPDERAPKAAMYLRRPNYKIKWQGIKGDYATYTIKVKVKGYVSQIMHNVSIEEIEKQAEETVEREIRETYRYALERGIDIYSLNSVLYRKHPDRWRKLQEGGGLGLSEHSLQHVEVKVDLIHTGKYKGKIKMEHIGETKR